MRVNSAVRRAATIMVPWSRRRSVVQHPSSRELTPFRGVAEHGVVDEHAEVRNVRSHAPNLLDRVLLYDVNFNYHREHHEHPQVPSCHLPAVQRDSNAPYASKSMFGTLRRLSASMRKP